MHLQGLGQESPCPWWKRLTGTCGTLDVEYSEACSFFETAFGYCPTKAQDVKYEGVFQTPPTVGVPDIGTQKVGTNVSPSEAQAIQDRLIAEQTEDWKLQTQKSIEDLAGKLDKCPWYTAKGEDGLCHFPSVTAAISMAGGVLLLIVLTRR